MESKRCTRCKEIKPVTEFWKGRPDCKGCWGEFKKKRRRDIPMKVRLMDRSYMAKYGKTTIGRFHNIKTNLKRRGIDLDINRDDFVAWFNRQSRKCHYCHREFTKANGRKLELTGLTIDRKNNSRGYTKGNLVLACRRCNMIKGSWFTEEQMLEIANMFLKN